MRKLIILMGVFGITLSFISCEDNLTDLNVNPKQTETINAEPLFTYGQYNLVKQLVDGSYNNNVGRFWANYLTETTYTQESNYDASNRDIGGSIWDNIYTESLLELRKAKEIVRSEEVSAALQAQKDNKLAMITILEVYAYQYLVDQMGPVPFTEALDIDNLTPEYDDDQFIYNAIIDSLQVAMSKLDPSASGFTDADHLYNGDMDKWQKFGYSLMLKLGLRIADVDDAQAQSLVQAAVSGGVFESNDDNASYQFGEQPYNNPVNQYFIVGKRASDFVVTQFFIDMLNDRNDPRDSAYFDENMASYVGGVYGGAGNAYSSLTHVDPAITEADYPGVIMDYAAVEFGLAEAVERGYIGGSAETHYEAAIRASLSEWGVEDTPLDLDNNGTAETSVYDVYLNQPEVDYNSSASGDTWREKIGTQKYIALYNQGDEAWIEARRLDFPKLLVAAQSGVANPKRMIYPVEEVLINEDAYAKVGGKGFDKTTSAVFWDVN